MSITKDNIEIKKTTSFVFNYLWLIAEVIVLAWLVKVVEFNSFGDIKYAVVFGVFGLAYYEMAWSGDTFHQSSIILAAAGIQFLFQLNGQVMFMYVLPVSLLILGTIRIRVSKIRIHGVSMTRSCLLCKSNYIDISRLEELRSSRTWVGKRLNFGSIHIPIIGQAELEVVSGLANVEKLLSTLKNQLKNKEYEIS